MGRRIISRHEHFSNITCRVGEREGMGMERERYRERKTETERVRASGREKYRLNDHFTLGPNTVRRWGGAGHVK